jgi:sugar (pentulose or hexulose) kinase
VARTGSGDLVAGIDLATAEVRVSVADRGGRVVARARERIAAPERPRSGWSEQDATSWWPAVADCLRQATSAAGERSTGIVAVAVAATSGTVVVVDPDGHPLGPALLYDDQRAGPEGETAAAAGAERWEALGFRPGATSGLAKWAWLVGRPGVADRAAHAWHASDVVVGRLTGGPPPTDWSHALKSGYDPARGEWATEAFQALGIPERLLPEVRSPGSEAGSVTAEAAGATGLPEGCAVRLGMTDGCAAQMAAGADRPGRFVTVLGTTMVVKGASAELVHDPSGAIYSHRHPDGWWLPGGASNTGGSAVQAEDPADLDRRAAARGPAGTVAYPLGGTGERFPFVAPDARGFRLGDAHDDVDRHRSALEGVAFLERLGYAHLADVGAAVTGPVRSAGGGGRSREWAAIRATALHRPVLLTEGADSAFGACILAAAETMHPDLQAAVEAMVTGGEEVAPVGSETEALDGSFARFVAALADRGWIDDRLRRASSEAL